MGIMVYSLLWVVQDFVHQPYDSKFTKASESYELNPTEPLEPLNLKGLGFRV